MSGDNVIKVPAWAMYTYSLREMRADMDSNEWLVFSFIFERTYTWGKHWDYISPKQFIDGVYKEGTRITPGVGLSRASLYRALASLQCKNMLHKRQLHARATPEYSINHAWVPVGRVPFTTIECLTRETSVSHPRDTTILNNTNIIAHVDAREADTPNVISEECNMTSPMDAVRAAASAATNKNQSARQRQKDKLNATALYKIFVDEFSIAYPDDVTFAWRKQDLAIFKRAMDRGVPVSDIAEFVKFCVASYGNVIRTKLSWMKAAPKLPTPGLIARQVDVFYEAYREYKDPNREVRQRIASAEKKVIVKEQPKIEMAAAAAAKALAEENRRLKEENTKLRSEEVAQRRKRIQGYRDSGKNTKKAIVKRGSPFKRWD